MKKPQIFDYLNYREFLKDHYDFTKSTNPSFSYRVFSEQTDMTKQHLIMIVNGKRNLTTKSKEKISKAFSLNPDEKKYFNILIEFNNESDHKKQTEYLKEMHKLSRNVQQKEIGDGNRLLSKWYYLAVKSLVSTKNFNPNPVSISKNLRDLITPEEAIDALETLLEIGLIEKDGTRYKSLDSHLKTKDETISLYIKNLHKQLLDLGSNIIDFVPQEEREFRAITIDVPASAIPLIKEKIKFFFKEIVNVSDSKELSEEVCQLNVQFFKLTNRKAS